MTRKVTTLDRNDTLDMAEGMMELGRVRHLAVVDDGKLVGVVSQRDLFRSALRLAEAAAVMSRKKIGCLPVVDDEGKMVGILSESDVLKHVAGR
jgi:CBS domain-containing protein